MSTGFTFDFLKSNEEEGQQNEAAASSAVTCKQIASSKEGSQNFGWFTNLDSKFNEFLGIEIPFDDIPVSSNGVSLSRVQENFESVEPTFRNTDLVSGVYEGGLKVWECSIDLCRYLQENGISIHGHVLELGCGHGLPGCWILKQACQENSTGLSGVVFSDFNEFVLRDVTIRNILLNTSKKAKILEDQAKYASWLSRHVALAFGDWNVMSEQISYKSNSCPECVPKDGKFDLILAAETTYSSSAASDTANLIARHLKADTGVALIATKRYYFGVGGGSDSLKEALSSASSAGLSFEIDTLNVYDDGSSNIRELLQVKIKR